MNKEYLYSVGEIVNGLEILEQIRLEVKHKNVKTGYTSRKGYSAECIVDGYEYRTSEGNLKSGKGCPVCKNKKTLKGFNDVATTHPQFVKYFVNIEDAYTHTFGSEKRVLVRCLDCGLEKKMMVCQLLTYGISCKQCHDGISYPEKFIHNILTQLNTEFKTQLNRTSLEWCSNKRYDFYLPKHGCIIEAHGDQHYKKGFDSVGGRALEEEQENDKLKRELAMQNGIEHYIELDCRKSELEWIKNSVMNSDLPNLLNFKEEDIDWIECEKYCTTSLMVQTIKLWNNKKEYEFTTDVANRIGINRATVCTYLKRASKLGMVHYIPEEESKRYNKINNTRENNTSSKRVICENMTFPSLKECSEYYNESYSKMRTCMQRKILPKKYYNMGLRYEYENTSIYQCSNRSKKNILSKKVVCGDVLFYSANECGKYYGIKEYGLISRYICGSRRMPQKYIDLGLRYATEEDIKLYKEAV